MDEKIKIAFDKYYLYLTVFIAGATVLILEILGTRIIAPYYGSTVYVWSSLITATLFALTLGYFLGGWLADKILRLNILYFIIFLAAIAILIIPLLTGNVLIKTNLLGVRYGALASAFILFTFPLVLLGIITPYSLKLKIKTLEKIGVTAGKLSSVATMGSLVGAMLIGFYLIPFFGVKSIIFFIGGLLFMLSFIGFSFEKKKKFLGVMLGVLLLVVLILITRPVVLSSNADVKEIYGTESNYAKLKVIDEGSMRFLLVDGATHTQYELESKEFIFPYLKLFGKAVSYNPNAQDVLVVGLGSGGIDRQLEKYGLNIDNVEIDPKIVQIAKDYFDFHGNVIIDDGRHYIKTSNKKYDLIYLDVYGGYSIYPYLFSKEAFEEVKINLNKGGILVVNVIGYENGYSSSDDKLILSIYKTLGVVFPKVYVKSTGYGLTNFVFYVSNQELELDSQFVPITLGDGGIVITDNYNPIETFAVKAIEEWRNSDLRRFGNEIVI